MWDGVKMSHMYKKIFEPIQVGSLRLKNRIVMGPMGTGFADSSHIPTPDSAAYYAERAKGGVALIIAEHTISQPVGLWGPHAAEIWSEQAVLGWKEVVDAIHENGALAAIQIGHMGRCTTPRVTNGLVPIAPSPVPCHLIQYPPHEVTLEEIVMFKADYTHCVLNAVKAGFDAVQLHLTNGYFLAEWLSGRTNKRTDKYGGTIEGRLRLPIELIEMIRREVGRDFPLIARLSSREINGGRGLEESKLVARALEEAGVDILDINAGSFSEFDWEFPPYYHEQGFLFPDVERIHKAVNIPVIVGGRITEPRMAEQALLEGVADLVEINRCHITDPYWVKKTAGNEVDSIRRCIGCTRCIDEILPDKLRCSVNPFVGKERQWKIERAAKPKTVMVIGGGPAGLQSAVVAAQRGHHVTLVERENQLGGLVRAAAVPPMKWEVASLISSLAWDAEKYGVEIVLGKEADIDFIKESSPDEVVLATGSTPIIPDILGIEGNVVVTALDVLLGKRWVGEKIAIIGGGMVGCEVADFLSEYNKDITVFEMSGEMGSDMWLAVKMNILKRLKTKEVKQMTSSTVLSIEEGVITYKKDNQEHTSRKFHTIILALGMKPFNPLEKQLQHEGIKSHVIGDAKIPLRLHEALTSAVEVTLGI
jgi:2,4-dienoyl-CoA reductase-like NADH-dependent reductase (Old Yellow Enzyme family)/thioredoxin reductase